MKNRFTYWESNLEANKGLKCKHALTDGVDSAGFLTVYIDSNQYVHFHK